MRQLVRWSIVVAALIALYALSQAGILASLDRRLDDWRLAAASKPVSDTIVVVEIDARSLAEIGVWPWPRSLHATLLDRLMTAGVEDVAFDIDFSSASAPFEDAMFTAALEQAGGYAWLAAFAQNDADGSVHFSRPLPEFAGAADPVLVNVLLDPVTGLARRFPIAAQDAAGTIPALAVQFARPAIDLPPVLEIDFGFDLAGLTRLSFTDILYGRVDPALLSGKQVIVGASAIELRDFFAVPRFGIVSGPLLQALAVETLKAGRVLVHWGGLPGLAATAALALLILLRHHRPALTITATALLAASAAGEGLALAAYAGPGILVDTASLHLGMLLLFGLTMADNGYEHLQGRRAAMRRLHFLATHDPLTGLWSRQGLLDQPAPETSHLLILVQIQGTDELRATLGHDLVESLLVRFAHRLRHTGFAELARTAPASFALLRPDDGDADRLAATARQLAADLSGAQNVEGHNLHIEVLAGYAAGAQSRTSLLSQAEIALIHARADRLRARGFSPVDQQALDRHRRLDRDLRQAIDRSQLHMVYQPQVDLRSRAIVGAESLMRWNHPELGMISPAEFIPLSEETGFILELGRWALEQACAQAVLWPSPIKVAVNVSAIQLQQADMVAAVRQAIERTGLPPGRLELEITESSRVTDPGRVRDVMWQLQALGLCLSIDDFGTGYSSLSYFRDLPFDTVKIDQGFVRGRTSEADRALLAAMIDLARKTGKQTIAEGIEDEATAGLLAQFGCTYGQGYHFSRPISGEALHLLLLDDRQRRRS